jgi:hypothetical protein
LIKTQADITKTVARNPACKTAIIWVKKTIRKINLRKELERRETKIGNYTSAPQTIWPITKSLMKRDGSKAPTSIHGPSSPKYHPLEKSKTISV